MKTTAIDKPTLEAELVEAKMQRDAAQQNLNKSQTMSQQAQQIANDASRALLVADGAIQQCEALLKKLDITPTP